MPEARLPVVSMAEPSAAEMAVAMEVAMVVSQPRVLDLLAAADSLILEEGAAVVQAAQTPMQAGLGAMVVQVYYL